MSMDIELKKVQLHRLAQSGGFLGKTLVKVIHNLDRKALIDLTVPLATNVLP